MLIRVQRQPTPSIPFFSSVQNVDLIPGSANRHRESRGFGMLRSVLVVSGLFVAAASASAADYKAWADKELDGLMPLYEHLHSHPEVSLEEKETADRIAKELKAAGFEVTTNVGGYGVVGLLKNGNGPTVMFRTDL